MLDTYIGGEYLLVLIFVCLCAKVLSLYLQAKNLLVTYSRVVKYFTLNRSL